MTSSSVLLCTFLHCFLFISRLCSTCYGQQPGERDIPIISPLSFISRGQVTSQESETKPLTFTFVPSIGRLPTHFEVVDISKFLVTVPEEPKDLSNQGILNKPNAVSHELAVNSGARQDCVSAVRTDSARTIFQSPGCNASKGEMQENDLFKAEFILITDSGDEDEVAAASNNIHRPSNGYGPISAQLLATSCVSPGTGAGKPPGDGNVPGAAFSLSTADPQKHQLISTLSTSDHLSSKPPAVHLISPTNQKIACGAVVNLNQASSLEDSRNNWQSATGFSKQESSLYFQSASCSSPSSMTKITSSASSSCYSAPRLYDKLRTPGPYTPGCVCKMGDFTSSVPAKSPSLSPDPPCSAEMQGSSAQPLSSSSSKRLNALSPVPVHIVTHSLSPSPKPLSPPSLYGSSSTICSINEPCTKMSSRGNLAKSDVRSPLPTRLTLLTAILRSGSSQRRPLSPASCPTFSPSSLGSSTLAIDQKSKTTPPTPKKSVSSLPIRPDSPSREEYWLSGWARHPPLPSKPQLTPRARSLSPKKHFPVGTLSPEYQSPLSSPVSSHRKSVASPGLQPTLPPPCAPAPSSFAHPTSPSPEGLRDAASRSQAPQKSQRVHTYSPIFTCRSYPLLSSTGLSSIVSPTLEKRPPASPSLLHSASRSKSKSDPSETSVQDMSTPSPTPSSVLKQWSLSWPHSPPPVPQTGNINSQPLQLNSSLVHTNYRSNSSSPRLEHSATSLVLKCRSPVSDKSPGTLPPRPRELTSPQSFSLPSDHENIKPKQYKIKTSYKAFAAIPTNTLLMEQKALEEPMKTASVTEGTALDTHSEMCSPAQLRQQTEELCAVIDQVLQDPLTMRRCESSPSFLQMSTESDVGKVSTTLQRAAGRETRYANLYKSAPMMTESQLTKPGVIRPVLVKAKSAQQKEEPYQPNPFKKYLEEISDQDTEQDNQQNRSERHREEAEALKEQLREREETVQDLKEQLDLAKVSLKDAEIKYATQLSSLQEVIQEKEALIEEQVHQHQAELLKIVAQSDLEAETQQNLRTLQRKLEEQETALLGRAQAVELLQQELRTAEQQNQILLDQCQKMEVDLSSLRDVLESERHESQDLREKMELELAERKMSSHRLQEEVQCLLGQLEEARRAQAALEVKYKDLEQQQRLEVEEKNLQISCLKAAEQELQSRHAVLVAENHQLKQDVDRLLVLSAENSATVQKLQDEPVQKPEEFICCQKELKSHSVVQVSELEKQDETTSQEKIIDQKDQNGTSLLPTENLERQKIEETPHLQVVLREPQQDAVMVTENVKQNKNVEPEVKLQDLLTVEAPASFVDCSSTSTGVSGELLNSEVQKPFDNTLVLHEARADGFPNGSKQFTEESCPPGILEYISAEKQKELSVLLLELQEAQEEITFLKRQLKGPSGLTSTGSQTGESDNQVEDNSQILFLDREEQKASDTQNELGSSSLLRETEMQQIGVRQENRISLQGVPQGSAVPCGGEVGTAQEASTAQSELGTSQAQELIKLQNQITELQIILQKSEESYKKDLGEKGAEINRLNELTEEYRKKIEDSDSAFCVLTEERDQLLHQMKELSTITELKERVKQLEENLALSEKQRLSDSQSSLLKEQIQSLKNEFKSKEIKIEALQKDLDEAQLQLSDQDMQLKDLRSQNEKKEREVLDLEQLLRKNTAEMEELSQNLASKSREAASLEHLVAEHTRSIESLQQTLLEKDQQMTEISVSMSEKMVLLNEEKFSLGNELKSLKEQTSLLLKAQEEKDHNIEAKDKSLKCGVSEQQYETEAASEESEGLVNKLELLKKENEQVKRKLQAALVSRKELLKKVGNLEDELVQLRGERDPEGSVAQEAEGEENTTSVISREVNLDSQPSEEYLIQLLSEKDSELQRIRKDLLDKETTEAQLQAVIEEMRQSLDGKNSIVSVKDEIMESQTIADKITETNKSPIDYEEDEENSSAATNLEENQKYALKERISTLEQEKVQLQKKLQEALVSRKDTIKKAQEKDRHHREQLKQQKDEYNILQEQFDKQSKEKESIQAQLRQLQEQKGSTESVLENQGGLDSSYMEAENTTNNKLVQVADVSGEEFKKKLEKLQMEKEELEYNASHIQSELACKSELVSRLQEHIEQLFLEIDGLKRTSDQAEAKAASLQTELEESRAKLSREGGLEELKTLMHQKDEEMEFLNLQLREKSEALNNVQAQLLEKEDSVKRLCSQLEVQAQAHEEQSKRLQTELLEIQEKQDGDAEAAKQKNQMQRKLQAALISRKEALKESKSLKEELANAKTTIENLRVKLTNVESQICGHVKETDTLTEKLASLTEEREKLIAELDKVLKENQNLDGCCKNLTFSLDRVVLEKEKLEKEMESLKCSQAAESSEWHEKYRELQKEYETLLQSYENVSNEAERIQRVLETVRQEKQEIFIKLKSVEAEKEETDKQLQEAGQEIDGMKEKMRKFAKSKQQKILELEEENEKLRAEMRFTDGELHSTGDVFTNSSLKEDLESSGRAYQSLSTQLETVMAEKESLSQEIADLKCHLQLTEFKLKESRELMDKYIAQKTTGEETNGAVATASPVERAENRVDVSFRPEPPAAELEQKAREGSSSCEGLGTHTQQMAELTGRLAELEHHRRASEQQLRDMHTCVETLEGDKRALETQMEEKVHELNALKDTLAKMEQMFQKTKDDLIRMTELKDTLEAEKDDLEERLMNQLAELNGSIGNYQQDATDFQIKNEELKHELQSLQRMMHELEEEKKCQMAKEESKASSEKQKQFVEKLKYSWRGDSTHVKELQELLKQKQQEIKQLQKDCIKSQEKNSSLERTVKALEFVQSESQKEVEVAKEALAKAVEDTKKAQAELALCRVMLDDTQSEAARVVAESVKVKEELQVNKENIKIQMKKKDEDFERRLEQEKDKHSKEIRNMEEKLAALQREKDFMETMLGELQGSLKTKDQEAKELEGSLNKTLAQLAAFTRSMSSLQDDRDRVIDESKTWEKKFTEAIQKKEEEIRSKEETCVVLKDQVKQMTVRVEGLQTHISRLELNKKEWESESRREIQHHQKTCEMLQEEKKELLTQLEASQKLYSESQSEQQKLESEISSLRDQLADLQNSFTKCELAREELGSVVKQQETSIQNFKFSCEQLQADLQASKDLTNKLHEEISAKDQKIISLLSTKEEAVMAALSELQQQHSEEMKELERRLSKEEEDKKALENEKNKFLDKLDCLTEKMKISREESKQQKAQLDSFTKSMSSLQDDRDRILRDYKQLEERHLVIILEKDQLIQEAAAENNKLKEEIRSFHSRMDDLNSENAKLNAELVRYREDLNQVISIKDSQQKQLLKTQLQRIQTLEEEKAIMETQLKEAEHAQDDLRKHMEALTEDKASMSQEIETLTSSLSRAQGEMTALCEGGPIVECQAQLKAREEETQELSHKLSLSQKRVTELEAELVCVQKDAAKRVGEAEDRLRKELKHLHHDAGIMRNETETAEERVAELARDLMEMEQKFLAVTDENKDLRAQIQSFGKSMSSLQDSRDQANEELHVLKHKYSADLEEQKSLVQNLQKQMIQLQEEQHSTARDRDKVRSELAELQKATDERGLLAQVEELCQQLRAKDDELLRLSSELEGSSNQLTSFSKAMASLQNERDRLLNELGQTRKMEEVKQQAEGSTSTRPSEVQSLKKALSSLQNDRDRVVRELKNLQEQYILVGVESAENSRLKAQLQEYQQDADKQHRLQEQLKQESISYQQELQQLREEKTAWERQSSSIKEQYLMAMAEKDKQLSHLQGIIQEMRLPLSKSQTVEEQYQTKISSEVLRGDFSSIEAETKRLQAQLSDSLKELHQKELRIQQLSSKLSQVFEEKNALSLQLRGSSRNICESHQHYNEVLNRCLVLERKLQELQSADKGMELFATDAAPGAPQEKNEPQRGSYTPELQELQLRLSETEHLHSSTKQDLRYLEEQLEEERGHRLAVEEALCAAQDQIRRLQSNEWTSSLSTSIDVTPGHEHSLLIDSTDNNFSKTRNVVGLRRLLHALFRSRTRLPLLVAMYLLAVHVLLLLCFTGNL